MTEADIVEAAREIGLVVTQQLTKYDHSRDPCDLDLLIYKLSQLYRVHMHPMSVIQEVMCGKKGIINLIYYSAN